ncbi:hypothetical protein [Nocardia brasiliensis]|uniref:hypothetical protein n=1 Tax=Nocardia brasiliensis TaxID=37326 RepID=UPI003D8B573C
MTGVALPARASTEAFEHVIGGTPQRVGTFWSRFADHRWEWPDAELDAVRYEGDGARR